MSDQDQTDSKGGIGVSGVVGGLAGGAGTYKVADTFVARRGIGNALAENEKAKGFAEPTRAIVSADAALKTSQHTIKTLRGVTTAEAVKSVEFAANESGKGFTATISAAGHKLTLPNVKALPEGFAAGTAVTDPEALKKFVEGEKAPLKGLIQQAEKELITTVRKAGGHTFGFRNVSGAGKAGIVAGTVAGAVVGAKVVHSIFGGKNTDKVEADRAQAPTAETARA